MLLKQQYKTKLLPSSYLASTAKFNRLSLPFLATLTLVPSSSVLAFSTNGIYSKSDSNLLSHVPLPSFSTTTTTTRIKSRLLTPLVRHRSAANANHNKINLLRMSTSTSETNTHDNISQIIQQHSLEQYDEAMQHFMFELGTPTIFLSTQQDVSTYIDKHFDAILFDCDGVLYRGKDAISNASESLRSLIARGKKILFVTNNAAQNRLQLRDKLQHVLDCPSLTEEQMVPSCYSAARYLQRAFASTSSGVSGGNDDGDDDRQRNVHVIGTEGLCDELRKAGFRVTGGPSLASQDDGDAIEKASMSREELAEYSFAYEEGDAAAVTANGAGTANDGGGDDEREITSSSAVDAVVIGLDTEFNYRKLCIANVLLQRNPNALLVATNTDAYDLVGADARHLPGNGALVKALEHASQRTAINVGKPSKILADLLMEEHGLDLERTLMVGDRLDTDIKFGIDGGMKSALVLTGCTNAEKLMQLDLDDGGLAGTDIEEPFPHIVFPHMGLMGLEQS